MNLVTSVGGPLIVMGHGALARWDGSDTPTDGRVIDVPWQFDPSQPATDYDRACAVRGPGTLPVGDAEALVLSSEAHNAVWLPMDRAGRGNVFLGQLSVEDEQRFQASLATIVDREFPRSDTVWRVDEPRVRLFDSAMAGSNILTPWEDVMLVPGSYEVRLMEFQLPGLAEVLMHKLVRRE
jgi:hypothetical protein